MSKVKSFKSDAGIIAGDLNHRRIIHFNMSKYDAAVTVGKARYSNLKEAKLRASMIKDKVIEYLPDYLVEFERNAQNNGAEVFWAENSQQIINQLTTVLQDEQTKMLVKSKSMVTEEIELNHHLENIGIESVETDLGEFIVQVAGEKPYHIVTPAMHKSKQNIAELFHQHFNTDENLSAEALTDFVRQLLRTKFINADVGITGANFLCAEEGAVAVTENEGNAFLSASFPKIHIVIAGIEKVIPGIKDLPLFWPLLASHGTGQQLTVYSNLFFGPKQTTETDGPERMLIFLLDNKRSEVYQKDTLKASLKCIRCGACLNGCPVYKNIGGYTYNTTYSGPIGSVISPHFKGFDEYNHLSFASSLCGKCDEVCPIKIPLTNLLLHNRQKAQANQSFSDKSINTGLYNTLSSRRTMNLFGGFVKTFFTRLFSPKLVGTHKTLSPFAPKTFNQEWKKKIKR
ncbi:lactate utilization protein B [Carboxylicivirga marina]|uniref:lactate utilization protein B n=1 Tax=Carboxylicivirga marina TaxID=2800988 RepID=UPI00259A90BA|nr:lactate utilization protein B [uncultured Carboxylicivirga sp.]